MTMSHNHSTLSEPRAGEAVPLGTLVYMRERNKQTVHEIVTDEFERSGLTVKELAQRTNRDPSRVSKFLSEVGNWTIDTISDYLFAMSGARLEYRLSYPLKDVAPTVLKCRCVGLCPRSKSFQAVSDSESNSGGHRFGQYKPAK